jgi:hypothetical protein
MTTNNLSLLEIPSSIFKLKKIIAYQDHGVAIRTKKESFA